MQQLREVVGPGPSDAELREILAAHKGNVAAATDAWFGTHDPAPVPVATPVPPPAAVLPPLEHLSVTVPPGLAGGAQLQVRTPDGRLMSVQVPDGLREGQQFLMRVPPAQPAQGVLVQHGSHPHPQQPMVHHHHHHSQPNIVYASPYPYYPAPYPYYDPFLPAAGFLGGMLVADALFW
mmetsp:Transcript_14136/g.43229  ORF Transcript_14136/g.43229 Transcript_14136/m.43229 type:complete len:178 (-) Transcript_14136:432-965(-)